MDVKARIEEVINQKGLSKREVSERMGKYNQAFNSLITNPKWDTIEKVAQALDITTENLLFGQIGEIHNRDSPSFCEDGISNHSKMSGLMSQSSTIGMLICPNCGKGFKIKIDRV